MIPFFAFATHFHLNTFSLIFRFGFLPCILMMAMGRMVFSSFGAEYEVKGMITQTIADPNVPVIRTTNGFTVYVRDCAWLIQTTETNRNGNVSLREMGSTNGVEIIEYESHSPIDGQPLKMNTNGGGPQNIPVPSQKKFPALYFASIRKTSIPVELLDKGVDGHLWLMFASRCYWSNIRTGSLTPVYDWHASVAMNPNLNVPAKWDLMNGPGSLPREIDYLGQWDETNGLYRITGTNSVGGILIPSGFIFEESHVGGLAPNSFVHEMVVRKRVEAEVTSVLPVCSRKDLLPVAEGQTVVTDWRLADSSSQLPSYKIPASGKWPSTDDAKKLVEAVRIKNEFARAALGLGSKEEASARYSKIILIAMSISLIGPPIIYFILRRSRKP